MALSGNIIPIHEPPFSDESLTSWLTRLGVYHQQIPSVFFRIVIQSQSDAYKQDIDVTCPLRVAADVSARTGKSIGQVQSTTFGPFLDKLYLRSETSTSLPRWIAPTFIRKNSPHHFGLKVCPLCLEQAAYLRLFWRCTFFVVCPTHKVWMIDRCERCNSPKSSRKIFYKSLNRLPSDSLCYCHHCGWDFRAGVRAIAGDSAHQVVISLLDCFTAGYFSNAHLSISYSHLFFEGMRILMNGLYRLTSPSLRNLEKHLELEFLPINVIAHLLNEALSLLNNWPDDFIGFCKQQALGKSDWIRPREAAPYWLAAVLKWEVNLARYSVTESEVQCAYDHLARVGGTPRTRQLVNLLGGSAAPRKLIALRKSAVKRDRVISEVEYTTFYEESERAGNTNLVILRTIVYATIYFATRRKHGEICKLNYDASIYDIDSFEQWLCAIGASTSDKNMVAVAWRWYQSYLYERKKLVQKYGHKEFLFISFNGTALSVSLALKSAKKLL